MHTSSRNQFRTFLISFEPSISRICTEFSSFSEKRQLFQPWLKFHILITNRYGEKLTPEPLKHTPQVYIDASILNLPDWATPYFTVTSNSDMKTVTVRFTTSEHYPDVREKQRLHFKSIKDSLREECEAISDWSSFTPDTIRTYARNYILCNFALGMVQQKSASIAKKNGTKPNGNDGLIRQHWIPEVYLNQFAKDGRVTKLSLVDGSCKGVDVQHEDFKEKEVDKGTHYLPHHEIILSKFEGDYGHFIKTHKKITAIEGTTTTFTGNLWDFLVITSFFLTLELRTKKQYESNHPGWNMQIELLLASIPQLISQLDVFAVNPKPRFELFLEKTQDPKVITSRLPFTQHPIYKDLEHTNDEYVGSFWAIHSPDILLWLRNKNSTYELKQNYEFLMNRLYGIIGNNTSDYLYFHPNDSPWGIGYWETSPFDD